MMHDPPAIHVVMEAGGSMLVDKIVSDSQELPVINTGVITLDGAIGIKVHVCVLLPNLPHQERCM